MSHFGSHFHAIVLVLNRYSPLLIDDAIIHVNSALKGNNKPTSQGGIYMVTQNTARNKWAQLMKEFDSDLCSLDLFLFLAGHPKTQFSHSVLLHVSNAPRVKAQRAITCLNEKRLLKSHTENGVSFYSLTNDQTLTSPLLQLVRH